MSLSSRALRRVLNLPSHAKSKGYEYTVSNLNIGEHTRVIYQGFTGRQATANAVQSLEYGTKIVGGVTPDREGEHLGLPLLPNVREAKKLLNPDATAIFVAAQHAAAAIEQAVEAEIPLIVAVAEHIPLHDMLRIHAMMRSQSESRLVGANAPGIISPIGRCRIGFQPLPIFSPGHVGVVAKSGTLSYETVASLTRAGLGQSLCIGMGGDVLAGTDFVDALRVFKDDENTHGIILVGEVGGTAEEEAALWIENYRKSTPNPKPIAALVAGLQAQSGRVMGHAGAWQGPGELSAREKYERLQAAGVTMVDHPARFGGVMKRLLTPTSGATPRMSKKVTATQRRTFHTTRQAKPTSPFTSVQKRNLVLDHHASLKVLRDNGFAVSKVSRSLVKEYLITLTIDRVHRRPVFLADSASSHPSNSRRFRFLYDHSIPRTQLSAIVAHLGLDAAPLPVQESLQQHLRNLFDLFKKTEAICVSSAIAVPPGQDRIVVTNAELNLDDAAYRIANRQADLHESQDTSSSDPAEVEALESGIVYIKLTDPAANIGTLVNGAGLAMNTNDALASRGGLSTNFLDTGGKATSETVKKSFQIILRDERVKVVFVNIFGGLTDCGMIAEGILLAFRELGVKVPVVVRLRGTNKKEGQRIIANSNLPLHAFDDFNEAAKKVIELANGTA